MPTAPEPKVYDLTDFEEDDFDDVDFAVLPPELFDAMLEYKMERQRLAQKHRLKPKITREDRQRQKQIRAEIDAAIKAAAEAAKAEEEAKNRPKEAVPDAAAADAGPLEIVGAGGGGGPLRGLAAMRKQGSSLGAKGFNSFAFGLSVDAVADANSRGRAVHVASPRPGDEAEEAAEAEAEAEPAEPEPPPPPPPPDPDEELLKAYRAGLEAGRGGGGGDEALGPRSASLPALPRLRPMVTSALEARWAADAATFLDARASRFVAASEATLRGKRRGAPPSLAATTVPIEDELRSLGSLLPASMAALADGTDAMHLKPRQKRKDKRLGLTLAATLSVPARPNYQLPAVRALGAGGVAASPQPAASLGLGRSRTAVSLAEFADDARAAAAALRPPSPRPPRTAPPAALNDTSERHMGFSRRAVLQERPKMALMSASAPRVVRGGGAR